MVGAHLYVLTMFFAGVEGQPVDIFKFYEDSGLYTLNLIASIGAFVFVARRRCSSSSTPPQL